MIILDASYAIDAILEAGDALLSGVDGPQVIAPMLFVDECRNATVNLVRRGSLSADSYGEAIDLMLAIPTALVQCASESVISLALQFGITGYDATYLAVAVEREAILATRDQRLAQAATSAGVRVLGVQIPQGSDR